MKKVVCLLITLIVTSNLANSQNTFHSLEDVWSYALANNKENTKFQLQVEKSIKDKYVANSYIYPKIYAGMSGQRNGAIPETPVPGELVGMPGETVFLQFGQTYNYSGGISTSKTLLDWQSRFQAKIAESNINLVKAEKSLFEQNLKKQIAQLYYAVLTAQAAIDLSEKEVSLADSTLLLTTSKYQQGLADKLTLYQAKINKNNASDRCEQNKQYLYESKTNLKILLGMSSDDTFSLSELIQLDTNSFIENNLDDDVSLNLYRIQTLNSTLATKQALSRFRPKLDVFAYLGGIQYQQDFIFSLRKNEWQPNRYIGLNLSVPLFTGFATKNQYQSAKISQSIAQINYDEAIRKSSLEDQTLITNYTTTKKLAKSAEQNLELADESVRLAYSKYSEGLISLDNYFSVYDEYLAVKNQYFNRLSDYFINKAIIQARNR